MRESISTRSRRLGWAAIAFILTMAVVVGVMRQFGTGTVAALTGRQLLGLFGVMPLLAGMSVFALTSILAERSTAGERVAASASSTSSASASAPPFVAQVVGLQWLNPLQRSDYPTEWQLLWTLGRVQPNAGDDLMESDPGKFSALGPVCVIAKAHAGGETLAGFHDQYLEQLIHLYRGRYWPEKVDAARQQAWPDLHGLRVEYALAANKLDPMGVEASLAARLTEQFEAIPARAPGTRGPEPDVRVTPGGSNAGFAALAAALEFLRTHPNKTAWVMAWDAPSFPEDGQLDENLVLLVLAGPQADTGREPLAWIGAPVSPAVADFEATRGDAPRAVQAWRAAIVGAARAVGNQDAGKLGYLIHDAGKSQPPERLVPLAQALTAELPEFDFGRHAFNTPAVLGEMRAASALTNIALGIAQAHHDGRDVLVAGTNDLDRPVAVAIAAPETPRPIDPKAAWFRAGSAEDIHLPWWGLRRGATAGIQGYSI